MKAHNILLFIIVIFILLAGLCIFFPKEGIDIGERKLNFPELSEVLAKEKKVVISAEEQLFESTAEGIYKVRMN